MSEIIHHKKNKLKKIHNYKLLSFPLKLKLQEQTSQNTLHGRRTYPGITQADKTLTSIVPQKAKIIKLPSKT